MSEQPLSLRNTEDDEPIAVDLGDEPDRESTPFEDWRDSWPDRLSLREQNIARSAFNSGRNAALEEARAERGMSSQEILELLGNGSSGIRPHSTGSTPVGSSKEKGGASP